MELSLCRSTNGRGRRKNSVRVEEVQNIRRQFRLNLIQRNRGENLADIRWFQTGNSVETLLSCFVNPLILVDFIDYSATSLSKHEVAAAGTASTKTETASIESTTRLFELLLLLDCFASWSFREELQNDSLLILSSLDLLQRVDDFWRRYVFIIRTTQTTATATAIQHQNSKIVKNNTNENDEKTHNDLSKVTRPKQSRLETATETKPVPGLLSEEDSFDSCKPLWLIPDDASVVDFRPQKHNDEKKANRTGPGSPLAPPSGEPPLPGSPIERNEADCAATETAKERRGTEDRIVHNRQQKQKQQQVHVYSSSKRDRRLWEIIWSEFPPSKSDIIKAFLLEKGTYAKVMKKANDNLGYRMKVLLRLEALLLCKAEEIWDKYRNDHSQGFACRIMNSSSSVSAFLRRVKLHYTGICQLESSTERQKRRNSNPKKSMTAVATAGPGPLLLHGRFVDVNETLDFVMAVAMKTAVDASVCLRLFHDSHLNVRSFDSTGGGGGSSSSRVTFTVQPSCSQTASIGRPPPLPQFNIRYFGFTSSCLPDCSFQITDICPDVFEWLRQKLSISTTAYCQSVCRTDLAFLEFASNSKSGNFFRFSWDGKYLIKSLSKSEAKRLIRFLPYYVQHLQSNPDSLLSRLFGLHMLEIYESRASFFSVASAAVTSIASKSRHKKPSFIPPRMATIEGAGTGAGTGSGTGSAGTKTGTGIVEEAVGAETASSSLTQQGSFLRRSGYDPFFLSKEQSGITSGRRRSSNSSLGSRIIRSSRSMSGSSNRRIRSNGSIGSSSTSRYRSSESIRSMKRASFSKQVSNESASSRHLTMRGTYAAAASIPKICKMNSYRISQQQQQQQEEEEALNSSLLESSIAVARAGAEAEAGAETEAGAEAEAGEGALTAEVGEAGKVTGAEKGTEARTGAAGEGANNFHSAKDGQYDFLDSPEDAEGTERAAAAAAEKHLMKGAKRRAEKMTTFSGASMNDQKLRLRGSSMSSSDRMGFSCTSEGRSDDNQLVRESLSNRFDASFDKTAARSRFSRRRRVIYFIVLGALYDVNMDMHEMYDLKGSSVSRTAHPDDKVKKDNDWIQLQKRLKLNLIDAKRFLSSHSRDCEFLATQNNYDYSLLVGIHSKKLASLSRMRVERLRGIFLAILAIVKLKRLKSKHLNSEQHQKQQQEQQQQKQQQELQQQQNQLQQQNQQQQKQQQQQNQQQQPKQQQEQKQPQQQKQQQQQQVDHKLRGFKPQNSKEAVWESGIDLSESPSSLCTRSTSPETPSTLNLHVGHNEPELGHEVDLGHGKPKGSCTCPTLLQQTCKQEQEQKQEQQPQPKLKDPYIKFTSATGDEVYFVGLIDFITPYSFRRYFHTAYKYTISGGPFNPGISPVPPRYYASRQVRFIQNCVVDFESNEDDEDDDDDDHDDKIT